VFSVFKLFQKNAMSLSQEYLESMISRSIGNHLQVYKVKQTTLLQYECNFLWLENCLSYADGSLFPLRIFMKFYFRL
jgi:hypothetical protein